MQRFQAVVAWHSRCFIYLYHDDADVGLGAKHMKLIDAVKAGNFKALVESITGFKYGAKKGMLTRGKNCAFRLDDCTAWSYSWWCFFKTIDGHAIFNTYDYSRTTTKHQSQVSVLLNDLGLYSEIKISTSKSLSDMSLADVRQCLADELNRIMSSLARCKRPSKKKDGLEHRKSDICCYISKIDGKEFEPNQIMIVERDAAQWGASDIGVHRLDPDEHDLADALTDAEKDGFDTVYVYRTKTKRPTKLKLVVGGC